MGIIEDVLKSTEKELTDIQMNMYVRGKIDCTNSFKELVNTFDENSFVSKQVLLQMFDAVLKILNEA